MKVIQEPDRMSEPWNCRCLKGHQQNGTRSGSITNRTGAESLSFKYPKLLYCPDQMVTVMVFSRNRNLTSKTVKPFASCGARCMGHNIRGWSAVCSEAPHSPICEGAQSNYQITQKLLFLFFDSMHISKNVCNLYNQKILFFLTLTTYHQENCKI